MRALSNSILGVLAVALMASFVGCAGPSSKPAEYPALPASAAAPAASPPSEAAPATVAEAAATPAAIEAKEVTYAAGKTTLKGFIAYPAGTEKRPGILVVHEWWGHNDYVRMRAIKLAEMGYVGFAIDMYGDGKNTSHPDDAKKFMNEALSSFDEAVKRFDAAKALLSADARVDATKLGAVGYCFGGAVALHMARIGTDLDVVATFHGNLVAQKPMARGAFGGKILVAQGGSDPFVPKEQLDAFKKEMDAAKAAYEVNEYPGAKHAFTNPGATELGTQLKLPLEYNAEADTASWQKLTQLLAATWGN